MKLMKCGRLMKLLIDGDTIAYMCGYATDNVYTFKLVKLIITKKLQSICNIWGTYDYEIFLTDTNREANFRDKLATIQPYKGNRKGEKPRWLGPIRDYLVDVHGAVVVSGIEADDELGKRQTDDTMIVTIDKDLLMIPGRHYNFKTDRVWVAYDPGQLLLKSKRNAKGILRHNLTGVGFKWLCAQCFLGDKVDNIPGLRGYGEIATYRLLNKDLCMAHLWDIVLVEFKKHGKLEQLLEIVELLWIQRSKEKLNILYYCQNSIRITLKGLR